MKKILSLLAVATVVSTSATNVVSCGTRIVESLNDPSYIIKGTKDLDVTSWSASAIATADYKSDVVDGIDDAIAKGSSLTYSDILVGNQTGASSDITKDIPYQLLADYQKNSNSVQDKQGWDDVNKLKKAFNITLYNGNDNGKNEKITTYSDGKGWSSSSVYTPVEQTQSKNKTKAYVFTFYVSVDPVAGQTVGSNNLVGARENYVGYKDSDGNVTKNPTAIDSYYNKNDPDFNSWNNVNGIHKVNGKAVQVDNAVDPSGVTTKGYVYETSFDYRFKVQFYIQLS